MTVAAERSFLNRAANTVRVHGANDYYR